MAFTIVGLADTSVREARERVQTAIRNSGYQFPMTRITVSLAPADVPADADEQTRLIAFTGNIESISIASVLGRLWRERPTGHLMGEP